MTIIDNKYNMNLVAQLIGLLFISDEEMDIIQLTDALNITEAQARETIENANYFLSDKRSPLFIEEKMKGYCLSTKPEMFEFLQEFISDADNRHLTKASLETLAIILYSQPITRSQISEIRGVNSDSYVTTLINKGYVREVGIAETQGNPALFGTTDLTLYSLGIKSLDELPELEQFAPDEDTRVAIIERINALQESNSENII